MGNRMVIVASAAVCIGLLNGCGGTGTESSTTPETSSTSTIPDNSASEDVLIVPRSVGGGVDESAAFEVDRDAAQYVESLLNKREAGRHALRLLKGARQRFKRALRIARRIENAALDQLPPDAQNVEFTIDTREGRTLCVRLSTAPFAEEVGGEVKGGAPIDADIATTGEIISLRLWINAECTGADEDYQRFYASQIEARPEDVELDEEDDSSESAWRAGRGRAWIIPGAILGEDTTYRARANWDHTDPNNRRTVFFETGRIGPAQDVARARYVVVRETSVTDVGDELVCKKVHATVDFREHPGIADADVRFGVCFTADEEGRHAERLAISGGFTRNDGTVVTLREGCFDAATDDNTCGDHLGPQRLDLHDTGVVDGPVRAEDAELPEEIFKRQPIEAEFDLDLMRELPTDDMHGDGEVVRPDEDAVDTDPS